MNSAILPKKKAGLRRPLLLPLVPLYAAGLALKRMLGGRQRRLESTVISVGSVSAGGAGKTPVVLMLAGLLFRREYAVRILTRGYGRSEDTIEKVDPEGDAVRYGDEPLVLAQRSGVPVYVGADRYEAGLLAEREHDGEKILVHLLDDGFQHRGLAREMDIVLLTEEDVRDKLLPAGNLREPLSLLKRADVIVLREEEAAGLQEFMDGLTHQGSDGGTVKPEVWLIRRRLRLSGPGGTVTKRPLAFCGIARPESFTDMLAAEGCRPAEFVPFKDHHRYTDEDMQQLVMQARLSGADGFVTTEKDGVKLLPSMLARLAEVGPVVVARMRVELLDEVRAMKQLMAMVQQLERRRGSGLDGRGESAE